MKYSRTCYTVEGVISKIHQLSSKRSWTWSKYWIYSLEGCWFYYKPIAPLAPPTVSPAVALTCSRLPCSSPSPHWRSPDLMSHSRDCQRGEVWWKERAREPIESLTKRELKRRVLNRPSLRLFYQPPSPSSSPPSGWMFKIHAFNSLSRLGWKALIQARSTFCPPPDNKPPSSSLPPPPACVAAHSSHSYCCGTLSECHFKKQHRTW